MNRRNEARHDSAPSRSISRAPRVHRISSAAGHAVTADQVGWSGSEEIESTYEDTYWREGDSDLPFVDEDSSDDQYGPVYDLGADAPSRYTRGAFDDPEAERSRPWSEPSGASTPGWDDASDRDRDAWDRVNLGF